MVRTSDTSYEKKSSPFCLELTKLHSLPYDFQYRLPRLLLQQQQQKEKKSGEHLALCFELTNFTSIHNDFQYTPTSFATTTRKRN